MTYNYWKELIDRILWDDSLITGEVIRTSSASSSDNDDWVFVDWFLNSGMEEDSNMQRSRIFKTKRVSLQKIIFNPNKKTTVLVWADGTSTVVKCMEGDEFDKRIGFAMAMMVKWFGTRSQFVKEVSRNPYLDEIGYAFAVLLENYFDSVEEIDDFLGKNAEIHGQEEQEE